MRLGCIINWICYTIIGVLQLLLLNKHISGEAVTQSALIHQDVLILILAVCCIFLTNTIFNLTK